MAGRYHKITKEEFEKLIKEYVDECEKKKQIATIAGFCYKNNISRTTFYKYKDRKGFSEIFESFECGAENCAWNGACKTRGIYYLKYIAGYEKEHEIDVNISFIDDITAGNNEKSSQT